MGKREKGERGKSECKRNKKIKRVMRDIIINIEIINKKFKWKKEELKNKN